MKSITCIILTVLLAGCVSSPSTWTKETRYSEYAYQTVHAVDLVQTLDIKNHPGLRETNWFLGEHPSDGKVAIWYVGTAVGHGFVTSAFEREGAPEWMKRTWQSITIGDAVNAVYGNYRLGLRVSF